MDSMSACRETDCILPCDVGSRLHATKKLPGPFPISEWKSKWKLSRHMLTANNPKHQQSNITGQRTRSRKLQTKRCVLQGPRNHRTDSSDGKINKNPMQNYTQSTSRYKPKSPHDMPKALPAGEPRPRRSVERCKFLWLAWGPAAGWKKGNGGMDYRDLYSGLYRDYYRDPFPHSLLSTREKSRTQTPNGFQHMIFGDYMEHSGALCTVLFSWLQSSPIFRPQCGLSGTRSA